MFGLIGVLAIAACTGYVLGCIVRPRRRRVLYVAPGRVVGDYAVFPCGCSFALKDASRRTLCAAHDAILAAEASA